MCLCIAQKIRQEKLAYNFKVNHFFIEPKPIDIKTSDAQVRTTPFIKAHTLEMS
jgi:hypothetical protein